MLKFTNEETPAIVMISKNSNFMVTDKSIATKDKKKSWRRQDYLEAGLSDEQIYIFELDFLIF